MLYAFSVLIPHQQTLGVSVSDALKVTDHYEDSNKARGYIASGIAESIVILKIVADYKSNCLKCSFRFFSISIVFLIAAIILNSYSSVESSSLAPVINSWFRGGFSSDSGSSVSWSTFGLCCLVPIRFVYQRVRCMAVVFRLMSWCPVLDGSVDIQDLGEYEVVGKSGVVICRNWMPIDGTT